MTTAKGLLEDARNELGRFMDDDSNMLIKRIDDYLAEPEPDAMEIVDTIRKMDDDRSGDYEFVLSDSEAAALIEDYGRRVPRVMLEELAIEILNLADLAWKSGWQEYVKNLLTAIFAKHGVQVEG